MWRVSVGGQVSDMVNLTRADAAESAAEREGYDPSALDTHDGHSWARPLWQIRDFALPPLDLHRGRRPCVSRSATRSCRSLAQDW
jgi:hypothetical protein